MPARRFRQYVELILDYCSLTYGVLPCEAEIGVTGDDKCFNTPATCQDRENIDLEQITLIFGQDNGLLPVEPGVLPSLESVNFTPTKVSLGEDLGERASLTAVFRDRPHSDTGEGFDKYHAERDYNPFEQGTLFGKFRARHPFIRGRPLRWLSGTDALDYPYLEARHFFMESLSGPDADGRFIIVAKDVLKLLDGDRAQCPSVSRAFLSSALTDTFTGSVDVSPTGVISDYTSYDGIGDASYLNIGGKEVVRFGRPSKLKLLLDGEGGSVTVDSSPYSHTLGNTDVNLSAGAAKFGANGYNFDGSDSALTVTNPGSDFTIGTQDFTIDVWIDFDDLNIDDIIIDFRPLGGLAGALNIRKTAANVIDVRNNSTVIITGTTVVSLDTSYHIALSRSSGVTRLFLNGAQQGSSISPDTTSYVNGGTGRPIIGASGLDPTVNECDCQLDELRIIIGVGLYSANFTPPVAATVQADFYDDTLDHLAILSRGEFNTTAQEHEAGERVQLVIYYEGKDPADILHDMYTKFGAVPDEYIPLTTWQSETDTHLGVLYTAVLAIPTPVRDLASELIEQAALVQWWDDLNQEIGLQVLRAVPASAQIFNEDNTLEGSIRIATQDEKRLSQVWTFFAQIDPLTSLTDDRNYRSVAVKIDTEAEEDYTVPAIKKVYSRWIPLGGRTTADRVNDILLSRFRTPPRKFEFEVMRNVPGAADVQLAGGYQLQNRFLQNANGSAETVPVQVTRLHPLPDRYRVEAEEILFTGDALDLAYRVITIDVDTFNVNLRDLHDQLFPSPEDYEDIESITFVIETGVIVGSTSTTLPAVDSGEWPVGVEPHLQINGRIQGKGGAGAAGRVTNLGGSASGRNGSRGGTALLVRAPITMTSTDGGIWAGGGGGGSGFNSDNLAGGGGGGGAGSQGGDGGAAGTYNPPTNPAATAGQPGTSEEGGVPGTGSGSRDGGAGGGPAEAGDDGETGLGGGGGAPGDAIDGVSFITLVGPAGDHRGDEIN